MKKDDDDSDDLRPEYGREDFGHMVRGKYAKRARASQESRFLPIWTYLHLKLVERL